MRDKNVKQYRKDSYIVSITQLLEWEELLASDQTNEPTKKVKDQIDDILTSLEVK